jgi:hypothetical protein
MTKRSLLKVGQRVRLRAGGGGYDGEGVLVSEPFESAKTPNLYYCWIKFTNGQSRQYPIARVEVTGE